MLSGLRPNSVTNWDVNDSLELFEQNWKAPSSQKLLIKNGYTPSTVIEYEIDGYGLRNNPNVNISECILTLGCSYTYGTGLHIKDTWSGQLAKMINSPVYNAGISGSSNDTAFRLANYLVPTYKPIAVVLLSTFDHRYEFYDADEFYNYNAPGDGAVWINNRFELAGEQHNELNTKKNIMAIAYLCNLFDVPFIHKSIEEIKPIEFDFARDLSHVGKKTQNIMASEIKKLLLSNNRNA